MRKQVIYCILGTCLSMMSAKCTSPNVTKTGAGDTSLRDVRIRTFIPVSEEGVTIEMCVSKPTGIFKYAYLGSDGNWYATDEVWAPGTKIKMGVVKISEKKNPKQDKKSVKKKK